MLAIETPATCQIASGPLGLPLIGFVMLSFLIDLRLVVLHFNLFVKRLMPNLPCLEVEINSNFSFT